MVNKDSPSHVRRLEELPVDRQGDFVVGEAGMHDVALIRDFL